MQLAEILEWKGLKPWLENYSSCLNYEFQNITNSHACLVYPVFFFTLHGGGKGSVSTWHSFNYKNVEKYTFVNSASSFQRPSLHVTVLNYMINILTALGTCVAVKPVCNTTGVEVMERSVSLSLFLVLWVSWSLKQIITWFLTIVQLDAQILFNIFIYL